MSRKNRYSQIIEKVFFDKYTEGAYEVPFTRGEFIAAAEALGIAVPKNLGDIVYAFRYRHPLPKAVRDRAPAGREWAIIGAGVGRYRFEAKSLVQVSANRSLARTKTPDATPGVIGMYALSDEQALLAKLRYNRLIDIFTGVTSYSLQNHLRTTVDSLGQIETDELYVGVDRKGVHYILPVQAKGGSDRLSTVQAEQDLAMCRDKFPALVCRPLAAQFVADDLIALFEFEPVEGGLAVAAERHYQLVAPDELSQEELAKYRGRLSEA